MGGCQRGYERFGLSQEDVQSRGGKEEGKLRRRLANTGSPLAVILMCMFMQARSQGGRSGRTTPFPSPDAKRSTFPLTVPALTS